MCLIKGPDDHSTCTEEKCILGFLLGQGKFQSQGAFSANSSHSCQRPPPAKAWPVSDAPENLSTPRGQGGLWREVVITVCLIFSQITQKIINYVHLQGNSLASRASGCSTREKCKMVLIVETSLKSVYTFSNIRC